MPPISTPESVRSELVQALWLDLIGPANDHAFANELLPSPPSRWYLTGFLVPSEAPVEQRTDETSTDEIDSGDDVGGTDDAQEPDHAAAKRSILPSSMGLSVLVAPGVEKLEAQVFWGDYEFEGDGEESEEDGDDAKAEADREKKTAGAGGEGAVASDGEAEPDALRGPAEPVIYEEGATEPGVVSDGRGRPRMAWRRIPREGKAALPIPSPGEKPLEVPIPDSGGLVLVVTSRAVSATTAASGRLCAGTRSVSVFLVNRRSPDPDRKTAYRAFAFQATLRLVCSSPFVARPDLRGGIANGVADEWDEKVADLQFRDVFEYAVGHGVSAESEAIGEGGACHAVRSTWIPSAEVERVAPADIPDVALEMEALGTLADGAEAKAKLQALVDHYRDWIAGQAKASAGLTGDRPSTAGDLLTLASHVANRIEGGIGLLADPQILDAFKIANRAMAVAARRRVAVEKEIDPGKVAPPRWRPFQLAFLLMTLRSIVDPHHNDREAVDLLFFPTGGGKTEAYLGLAAFTMALRRLRNPGISSAGVSVLMRYTLRLLTLDQLGRAATLMCALELERERDTGKLGDWPFEIGLWVGQGATPNRMGGKGYKGPAREYTAHAKTLAFKRGTQKSSPIPIESCPWCGTKFTRDSFRLVPNQDRPLDLRVHCVNHNCDFCGDRYLPIVAVDEPLYRRLPAFLIATVDKFAALPWTGEVGALFGLVNRYDKNGFYGPASDQTGTRPLTGPLPPPDLIIQDELHLISGPLGTVAGLYETAIDALATRTAEGKSIRPKIIASTATVRRADTQIRALFERSSVTVFPPPGPDRRDSFFAKTLRPEESPARLYVGVAAQGRSLKVVLLRASLALLSASKVAFDREGGSGNPQNPADPYMTLVGYFNSLRELGGSRRIVEDEVQTRLADYWKRRRLDPTDRLFGGRKIDYDVLELTSRVSTGEVADAKRRLALPFRDKDRVDVALATNMISVGLDILRLGLMVVLGQPKASAEYIQATSRVGREAMKPGLVVTLLNVHKPRDRSHYERFATYHATFYRSVEATSVTPFSPRALDRALPAALVGLCRHGRREMTPPVGASEILTLRAALASFATRFAERAREHDNRFASDPAWGQRVYDKVLAQSNRLLDDWLNIARGFQQTSVRLQYQQEIGNAQRLLHGFLSPELASLRPVQRRFRANRSMRDVEPSVDLTVKNLNDWGSHP